MVVAKEEGVPDATDPGATAPHQLLCSSPEHHQSRNYKVLDQKGSARVSSSAGSMESQSPRKIDAM